MKRSNVQNTIMEIILDNDCAWDAADAILKKMKNIGMLPPNCTVTLVEDKERGGVKHTPTERKWDDET